jgi:hypothetical protein
VEYMQGRSLVIVQALRTILVVDLRAAKIFNCRRSGLRHELLRKEAKKDEWLAACNNGDEAVLSKARNVQEVSEEQEAESLNQRVRSTPFLRKHMAFAACCRKD